jgi:putative nucleotidyltransferase with HDIG domain
VLRALCAAAGPGLHPALVGGAVRDACLVRRRRRPVPDGRAVDLDVAVPHDALAVAGRLAERLGGTCVVLDARRGAARVVAGRLRVDVADFRAPTLVEDLRARDFTVDALAADVRMLLRDGEASLLDPTGGLADLAAGRLRPPSAHVLLEDPLRVLRGVRLEATLGLVLVPGALRAARAAASRLGEVAAERVRDELGQILAAPSTASALRRLDRIGALAVILPEVAWMRSVRQPSPHRFTVLEHSFRAVEGADRLVARTASLGGHGGEIAAHLAEGVGGGLTRAQTLKLAALLHDVSKPETRAIVDGRIRFFGHDVKGAVRARAIGERFRLADRVTSLLERLVRHHLRPMHLMQAGEITLRARHRFFRDLGDDARDLLVLALVDGAAVRGESPLVAWRRSWVVRELLDEWPAQAAVAARPPLLRGEDVMRRFALAPGPPVGALLARAREAQDLGLVRTREEALAYLDSSGGGF